jgi:hypothetical protein
MRLWVEAGRGAVWAWISACLFVLACSSEDEQPCQQLDENLYACGYWSNTPGGSCGTSKSRCESECLLSFDCSDFDDWEHAVNDPAVYLCLLACTEYILCESGESIPSSWRCDDEMDCTDGSDEAGCE